MQHDPSTDLFDSLPLDVLAYVASFIRLRPRLLILSILSHRWRNATMRSITSLSPRAPRQLLCLPSLTRLRVPYSEYKLQGPVSGSVLDLELGPHALDDEDQALEGPIHCRCQYLASLRSLTRLHIPLATHSSPRCDDSLGLVLCNPNLTDLTLYGVLESPWSIPGLASLHLPRLLRLTICGIDNEDAFVTRHAAQVLGLSVLQPLLQTLKLPKCVSLGLLSASSLNRDFHAELLQIAPRLTRLEVLCPLTVPVSRFLEPLLASVHIEESARPSVVVSLQKFSAIDTLTASFPSYLSASPFIAKVRTLTIYNHAATATANPYWEQFLASATQLRSLTVSSNASSMAFLTEVNCPHLRRLELYNTACSVKSIAAMLQTRASKLECLGVSVRRSDPLMTRESLEPYVELMRIAQRMGLRKLILVSATPEHRELLAEHARHLTWLTVRFYKTTRTREFPKALPW